jgi:hypothetical protein
MDGNLKTAELYAISAVLLIFADWLMLRLTVLTGQLCRDLLP